MRALMGIGRVGGVAEGLFQAERAADIRALLMHIAKDGLLLGGVLGVEMVADLGLEVRRHLGAMAEQCTLRALTEVAPCAAYRRHLVFRQAQQRGDLLAVLRV